jgi:hypothetical protein
MARGAKTLEEWRELAELNKQLREAAQKVRELGTPAEVFRDVERGGETRIQREVEAGAAPAAPAVKNLAEALGINTLAVNARTAFGEMAVAYNEVLGQMEARTAQFAASTAETMSRRIIDVVKRQLDDEFRRS